MAEYIGCNAISVRRLVEELVNEGKLDVENINESCRRVLTLKFKLGLFENPYGSANIEESKKILACPEHREIARRSAEESAVLLKNEGVLPFSKDVKRVAVIGPHANNKKIVGSWWCAYKQDETVTVLEGVRSLLPNAEVICEMGCSLDIEDNDYSQIDNAVALAKSADAVILCVGEDQADSGESNSKAKLALSSVQRELIKRASEANKNTALVLFTGRPLVLSDIEESVGAILNMYFPGTEGGNAVADRLNQFAATVVAGRKQ